MTPSPRAAPLLVVGWLLSRWRRGRRIGPKLSALLLLIALLLLALALAAVGPLLRWLAP